MTQLSLFAPAAPDPQQQAAVAALVHTLATVLYLRAGGAPGMVGGYEHHGARWTWYVRTEAG